MNIKYDFTQEGGIPIDQNVFNDLQNGILEAENALATLVGTLVIISGCVLTGGVVSNGIVAINGQIMPFIGGAVGTKVIINPATTGLTYFDGSIKNSLTTQYATFGDDGVQNNLWANFVQLPAGGIAVAVNNLISEIIGTDANVAANTASIATAQTAITALQNNWTKKLASGTKTVGDVGTPGTSGATIAINFTTPLTTTNYMVLFSIISLSETPETDGISFALVTGKTEAGFTLYLHEPASNIQDINIDWIAIAL